MTYPAAITTGDVWPDNKLCQVGPFSSGTSLYVILVDKSANKLRAYRSQDAGHTWAEADSSNAPACSSTTLYKGAHVVQSSTTLYAIQALSSTSMNIVPFDCSGNAWGSAVSGPATIAINSTNPGGGSFVPRLGTRRSDGSFVFAYQGATESVMGTAYARIKIHIRSAAGTWTGPFDIVGSSNSPIANTLPSTQINYVLRAVLLGTSDRVILFYTHSTNTGIMGLRVLTSSNTFAAAATTITTTSAGNVLLFAPYMTGHAALYLDGATSRVALPLALSGGGTIARCAAATAETAANWSFDTPFTPEFETVESNPLAVSTDGSKLWLWYVDAVAQGLYYKQDAGAGTWSEPQFWKGGAELIVSGFSALPVPTGLGVVYYDALGAATVAQLVNDADHRIGYSNTNNEARAFQKIRFASGTTLRYVRILARITGAVTEETVGSGALTVGIYADSSGSPNQSSLVGTLVVIGQAAMNTGDAWMTCQVDATLSAATDYWILIRKQYLADAEVDPDYYFTVRLSSTTQYANGHFGTGTTSGGFTAETGKDLAFQLYTTATPGEVEYDRLDTYAAKASTAVGSTSRTIDLGETPPATYEVIIDLGAGADPAGSVTVYIDGGWDDGALNPIATDGPNAVQAQNSITLNSPPRYIRVTTVVESATSTVGVAGA